MDSLKKAIDMRYGGFKRWMESRGIKIRFDNTIWALALFGELHEQYAQEDKNAKLLAGALNNIPIDLLKNKITEREKRAAEAKEKAEDTEHIHKPKDKPVIVSPNGQPIK